MPVQDDIFNRHIIRNECEPIPSEVETVMTSGLESDPSQVSVEQLDQILLDVTNLAEEAERNERETAEGVEENFTLFRKLIELEIEREDIEDTKEKDSRNLQGIDPAIFDPDQFELLRVGQEYPFHPSYLPRLQATNRLINELTTVSETTPELTTQIEKLKAVREAFMLKISEAQHEKLTEVSDTYETNMKDAYTLPRDEVMQRVAVLTADKRLMSRLETLAEQDYRIHLEKKFSAPLAAIRFLEGAHIPATKRLGELTGNPGIFENLRDLSEKSGEEFSSQIDQIRKILIERILVGEGRDRLRYPGEIIPWRGSNARAYYEALKLLKSDGVTSVLTIKEATGSLEAEIVNDLSRRRTRAIMDNRIIFKIGGAPPKKGQKSTTPFWKAFDDRKESDERGSTVSVEPEKKHQPELTNNVSRETRKKIDEILSNGGYTIDMPLFEGFGKNKKLTGTSQVAISINRRPSKKDQNKEVYEVVDAAGDREVEKFVGKAFSLGMHGAPKWLRDAVLGQLNIQQ